MSKNWTAWLRTKRSQKRSGKQTVGFRMGLWRRYRVGHAHAITEKTKRQKAKKEIKNEL